MKELEKKISEKNSLWVACNFVFPKIQEGQYVKKSLKYKVFVDEILVASIGKEDKQSFLCNLKFGCKVDVLKGDPEIGEVYSSFSWNVGDTYATLFLSQDISKKVKMVFQNQNRVEVFDERDFEKINSKGLIETRE